MFHSWYTAGIHRFEQDKEHFNRFEHIISLKTCCFVVLKLWMMLRTSALTVFELTSFSKAGHIEHENIHRDILNSTTPEVWHYFYCLSVL